MRFFCNTQKPSPFHPYLFISISMHYQLNNSQISLYFSIIFCSILISALFFFTVVNILNYPSNFLSIPKMGSEGIDKLSLDSIRQTLIELEDTIIFAVIGRSKFMFNSPAYASNVNNSFPGSLMEFLVKGTESIQAQGGRYQTPEEVPFFPDGLPSAIVRTNCSQILPSIPASVTVNKNIWDIYLNKFLPLVAAKGDDGNYALAVSSDLVCLQALSRRIHYGKYVAEVKFRSAPEAYSAAIRAKDKEALMEMLTDKRVEAMVKQRVEKKAMIFGQEVTLNTTFNNSCSYKAVNPSLVSRLYNDWVIPLTKDVEVDYLLLRLDCD